MLFNVTDRADVQGARLTTDGYLVANVLCARTGVQVYSGSDFDLDMETVRVHRPEEEVFSMDSLASYVGKPATDDHPPVLVNADNWKNYSKGSIGEGVLRDGEFVRVPITLMDTKMVKKVMDGKRELSMGYTMSLEMTSGTNSKGEKYDAIARDLKMNHIAVVDRARAGSKARIGDNINDSINWGISPVTIEDTKTMSTVKVTVDGLQVETTEQGASAIAKLQSDRDQLVADADKATTDHATAIADKDKEIAAKDTEIEDLKKNEMTADQIDKMAEERATLLTKANAIVKDGDFKGKTNLEIMKMCVVDKRGEDSIEDKSDAYIEGTFDSIEVKKDDKKEAKDNFRKSFIDKKEKDAKYTSDSDNGHDNYVASKTNAWKGDK